MRTSDELSDSLLTEPGDAKAWTIILVGAEGGVVELRGVQTLAGWRFRVHTDEALLLALSEADASAETRKRPWVGTWRDALKQLDAYPWPHLYPLEVHPEFRRRVRRALRQRAGDGDAINWTVWNSLLGAPPPKGPAS